MTKLLTEKWDEVLEVDNLPKVRADRKAAIATMLENQAKWNHENGRALREMLNLDEAAPTNFASDINSASTGNIQGYDPILISMVRRAAPQMIAFDVCGVQPMQQSSGLIFAMKARYAQGDTNLLDDPEALFDEALTDVSGKGTHAGDDPSVLNDAVPGTYTTGTGLDTVELESLGDGTQDWAQMGMTIERIQVIAKGRGLRADYSHELQQDLRTHHGLDAEKELASILSTEILAEVNREVIRDIYTIAEIGAQTGTANAGIFDLDTDSNGRWSVEKFKGLMFQLEREANQIAIGTRRGKGNILICSQDIASALATAGLLDYNPALQQATQLNVDVSSQTFAGVLNGRMKVFVDPYLSGVNADFAVVGYKGSNEMDAGYFYCPYVPLQMYTATAEDRFQPRIAFKTRYGKIANPFANRSAAAGTLTANDNKYYRKIKVVNIL